MNTAPSTETLIPEHLRKVFWADTQELADLDPKTNPNWKFVGTTWEEKKENPDVYVQYEWVYARKDVGAVSGAGTTIHIPKLVDFSTTAGYGNAKRQIYADLELPHLFANCAIRFWSPFWVLRSYQQLALLAPLVGGKRSYQLCEKCWMGQGNKSQRDAEEILSTIMETVPRGWWV